MRLLVQLLPVCMLALSGCGEVIGFVDSDRFKEEFRYSYPLRAGARVELETRNGSVELVGWDEDKIEIVGTKFAPTQDALRQITIDIQQAGSGIRIRTLSPQQRGNWGARYVLRLPRRVELNPIITSNGSIRLDGIQGDAWLRSSNGAIRVDSLRGNLDAKTSNSAVDARNLQGSALVRTSNGSVRLEEVQGRLDVETSNASITARLRDPEVRQPIRLESSNGSVELTMESLHENPIRVETSNARITLNLPQNVRANVDATTSSGSIDSDFSVASNTSRSDKHRLAGAINGGGPLLDLRTSNASIRLHSR